MNRRRHDEPLVEVRQASTTNESRSLLRGAADAWGADLRQEWPGLSLLVISIGITLPMAAWMRFRGMKLRPILEMSAAAIVAVMVAAWFGIISASGVGVGTVCGLPCVAMFAAMLFRLGMYTGRSGHHHHG